MVLVMVERRGRGEGGTVKSCIIVSVSPQVGNKIA